MPSLCAGLDSPVFQSRPVVASMSRAPAHAQTVFSSPDRGGRGSSGTGRAEPDKYCFCISTGTWALAAHERGYSFISWPRTTDGGYTMCLYPPKGLLYRSVCSSCNSPHYVYALNSTRQSRHLGVLRVVEPGLDSFMAVIRLFCCCSSSRSPRHHRPSLCGKFQFEPAHQ